MAAAALTTCSAQACCLRHPALQLAKIVASEEESHSFWQRRDYKAFSPSTDWDSVDWDSGEGVFFCRPKSHSLSACWKVLSPSTDWDSVDWDSGKPCHSGSGCCVAERACCLGLRIGSHRPLLCHIPPNKSPWICACLIPACSSRLFLLTLQPPPSRAFPSPQPQTAHMSLTPSATPAAVCCSPLHPEHARDLAHLRAAAGCSDR